MDHSTTTTTITHSPLEKQQDSFAELKMIPTSTSSSSLTSLLNGNSCEGNTPSSLSSLSSSSLRHRRRRSYSFDSKPERRRQRQDYSVSPIPPFTPSQKSPRPLNRQQSLSSAWLIRADHPLKITWDALTILLSVVYIYVTHTSIRDRSIRTSNFGLVCDAWFLLDIFLNFVTEYRTDEGVVLRRGQAVWARYLTTWFVVDALSLVPWESLYIKPIIEMQNKRHFVKKYFFRTKAVVRVSRLLRGRHFRLFGKVARHSKHAGVGANRLLRLLIKYVPKYLLWYRNMRGVLAVRFLRQIHWIRKMWRNIFFHHKVKKDDATDSLTMEEYDSEDEFLQEPIPKSESMVHIDVDDDIDISLY